LAASLNENKIKRDHSFSKWLTNAKKQMSTSIDPTSYIAVVRTAVWDNEPESAAEGTEESSDLIEWLATIGQDITKAPEKTTRFMAWAIGLRVEPPGRTMEDLAAGIDATKDELTSEVAKVAEILTRRESAGPVVTELIRQIACDIHEKRNKVQRLLNWLFVLKSAGPEFSTFQAIGQYCGVSRQAVHKDVTQIYNKFPYLASHAPSPHAATNRRNTKLRDNT
jgi:hypothetical protein